MKLKHFNINKAIDKYSGNTTQFLVVVFLVFTITTTLFVLIKLPSEIEWYRATVVFIIGLLLSTYLENLEQSKK